MRASKKAILVILFLGIGLFGYSQYIAASNIGVIVTETEFLEKNDSVSTYNVQLEFDNPSFLILNAGKTDFTITVKDKKIADGVLEPFLLSSMSKATVNGIYQKDEQSMMEEYQSSTVIFPQMTKQENLYIKINLKKLC
jgi:hypothetical protein